MKDEPCYGCGEMVQVESDYEPKFVFDSRDCGCIGMIENPIFCDNCESAIFECGY